MRWFEILLEGRKEALISKNADRCWQAFTKSEDYKNIDPSHGFNKERLMDYLLNLDNNQTTLEHGQWICNLYASGNLTFEDASKIPNALKKFDSLQRFLQIKDINHYKTLPILATALRDVEDLANKHTQKKQEEIDTKSKLWSEIDTVYKCSSATIYIPKTEEASCFLGKGTEWCTAAVTSHNYFEDYNSKGPLYIIFINENDSKGRQIKYQFHLQDDQYMDVNDSEIILKDFYNKYPDIKKFFDSIVSSKMLIKNPKLFEHKINIDEKLANEVIPERGGALKYIPKEIWTRDLVIKAIKDEAHVLNIILDDDNFCDLSMVKLAVSENGLVLPYLRGKSRKFLTPEVVNLAIKNNGNAIKFVYSNNNDIEKWGDDLNKIIPITTEMMLEAVKSAPESLEVMGYDPDLTPEIIMAAVKKNAWVLKWANIFYIKENLTTEIIFTGLSERGDCLKFVNGHPQLTYECVKAAILNDPTSVKDLDKGHRQTMTWLERLKSEIPDQFIKDAITKRINSIKHWE